MATRGRTGVYFGNWARPAKGSAAMARTTTTQSSLMCFSSVSIGFSFFLCALAVDLHIVVLPFYLGDFRMLNLKPPAAFRVGTVSTR